MNKKLLVSLSFGFIFCGFFFWTKKNPQIYFFEKIGSSIREKRVKLENSVKTKFYGIPEIPGRDIRQNVDLTSLSMKSKLGNNPRAQSSFPRNFGTRVPSPQERRRAFLEKKGMGPLKNIKNKDFANQKNGIREKSFSSSDKIIRNENSHESSPLTSPIEEARDPSPSSNSETQLDAGLPVYDETQNSANIPPSVSPTSPGLIGSDSGVDNENSFGINDEKQNKSEGSSSSGSTSDGGGGFFGEPSGFLAQTGGTITNTLNQEQKEINKSSGGTPPSVPQLPNTVPRSISLNSYSLGSSSFCLVVEESLFCRGSNAMGELGLPTDQLEKTPILTKLVDFEGFTKSVHLGENFTCTILLDGTVSCFGDNSMNKLSSDLTGTLLDSQGNLIENVSSLSLGLSSACSLSSSGEAHCWGLNDMGQLGIGETDENALGRMATKVNTTVLFKKIKIYDSHACGLSTDNHLYCWGDNSNGKLGINSLASNPNPTKVIEIGEVLDFALGVDHTCAIKKEGISGRIYCWGSNSFGQILSYDEKSSKKPIMISTKKFKKIASSERAICAIDDLDKGYCWGEVSFAGNGQISRELTKYPGMDSVSSIEGFHYGFCFRSKDSLFCIGKNNEKMFGQTITDFILLPEPVNYNGLNP